MKSLLTLSILLLSLSAQAMPFGSTKCASSEYSAISMAERDIAVQIASFARTNDLQCAIMSGNEPDCFNQHLLRCCSVVKEVRCE